MGICRRYSASFSAVSRTLAYGSFLICSQRFVHNRRYSAIMAAYLITSVCIPYVGNCRRPDSRCIAALSEPSPLDLGCTERRRFYRRPAYVSAMARGKTGPDGLGIPNARIGSDVSVLRTDGRLLALRQNRQKHALQHPCNPRMSARCRLSFDVVRRLNRLI